MNAGNAVIERAISLMDRLLDAHFMPEYRCQAIGEAKGAVSIARSHLDADPDVAAEAEKKIDAALEAEIRRWVAAQEAA